MTSVLRPSWPQDHLAASSRPQRLVRWRPARISPVVMGWTLRGCPLPERARQRKHCRRRLPTVVLRPAWPQDRRLCSLSRLAADPRQPLSPAHPPGAARVSRCWHASHLQSASDAIGVQSESVTAQSQARSRTPAGANSRRGRKRSQNGGGVP